MPTVRLRPIQDSDLPLFFEQQRDPQAVQMAAFTAENPDDRDAFDAQWRSIRQSEDITLRTILYEDVVVGSVSHFTQFGKPSVGYWLDRAYWGQGIATEALRQFMQDISERPLYARVAQDNIGSRRVLEKCGFSIIGEDRGYAAARGEEIAEYILATSRVPHCDTCARLAQRDAGHAPLWDAIYRTPHWDLVHAYNTSLRGWLVLVVRRHIEAVDEMGDVEALELGRLLRNVSRALKATTGCQKTYVMQFAESPSHPHVHFHIVPRMADQPEDHKSTRIFKYLGVPQAERVSEAEMTALAEQIRAHMTALDPDAPA